MFPLPMPVIPLAHCRGPRRREGEPRVVSAWRAWQRRQPGSLAPAYLQDPGASLLPHSCDHAWKHRPAPQSVVTRANAQHAHSSRPHHSAHALPRWLHPVLLPPAVAAAAAARNACAWRRWPRWWRWLPACCLHATWASWQRYCCARACRQQRRQGALQLLRVPGQVGLAAKALQRERRDEEPRLPRDALQLGDGCAAAVGGGWGSEQHREQQHVAGEGGRTPTGAKRWRTLVPAWSLQTNLQHRQTAATIA